MKKLNLLILFALTVLFISCSDDSTSPSKPDYYPLNAGNYWIYEQYQLDSNGNKVIATKSTDSAIVIGTQTENVLTFNGVTTYKTQHNYSIGSQGEQRNYATEDAIYQYFDQIPGFGFNLFGLKLSDFIPVNWVKMIDFKNASWVILTPDTVELPQMNLQGQNVKLSLIFSMTGNKGMTKTFTVDSKSINTQDYVLSFNVSGSITLLDLGGMKLPINMITVPTHFYLADGIGLVSTKTETVKFSIASIINQTLTGSESTLTKYKIIK